MLRARWFLGVGCLALAFTAPLWAQEGKKPAGEKPAGDKCAKCMMMQAGASSFCEEHGKGMAFGVALTSKDLFDAMQGVKVDKEATAKCPGCKEASETNGKCDHCKVYFVAPRSYKTAVAHSLAKGKEVASDVAFKCESCKKAWAENGACTACNHFFAAHRMYKSADEQKMAMTAHATLEHAAASKCPTCAMAMVNDGTCEHCKVTYKDGAKVQG